MISIDQVLLLQQKVESAVQKIVELKSENDALRRQCSELTNALSEKTELLNSFTADEKKIEDSILGALDRLNKIENSVLSQAGQNVAPKSEAAPLPTNNTDAEDNTDAKDNTAEVPSDDIKSEDVVAPEFDMDTTSEEPEEKEEKFDIF
ncbi:cell division protein ZapB [Treponema sp.]|uniref:cell division protein ZapB n=1 Tax=Treponema sp. TaxID=166 RepID=UPI00298DADBF|nr:cell division protein ZapB [Treponema sp.]